MDIRIGIQHAPREITIETDDTSADVEKRLEAALKDSGVIRFEDNKGQVTLIPAGSIAYIEFGQVQARPVGFVS